MAFTVQYRKVDAEHGAWFAVESKARATAEADGYHIAVLEIDPLPKSGKVDPETTKYRGPLVFDIDIDAVPPDPTQSIIECNKLLDVLVSLGVDLDDIQVFASGGKGFHVYVPPELISIAAKAGCKNLPYIYKYMAAVIEQIGGVRGIDHGLYAGGRGHMIRVPNKQRSKDGRYKVPVTVLEVRAMTPQDYLKLTSQPRNLPTQMATGKVYSVVPKLAEMFIAGEKNAAASKINQDLTRAVPNADLSSAFNDNNLPRCVDWIMTHTNIREDDSSIGTNYIGMQLGSFLAGVPLSQVKKEQILVDSGKARANSIDSNNRRVTNKSEAEIIGILRTKTAYATHGGLHFSCLAMRRVFPKSNPPCDGCPIAQTKQKLVEAEYQIEKRTEGYFKMIGGTAPFQLTNWILEPIALYMNADGDGSFEASQFILHRSGWESRKLELKNDTFNSKAKVKEALSGTPGCRFDGNDDDATALWAFIFDSEDMDRVNNVNAVGIHAYQYPGQMGRKEHGYVYVEPGWSVNHHGVSGTHQLTKKAEANAFRTKRLQGVTAPKPSDPDFDEANDALVHAMNINYPEVNAAILGWVAACHLRGHIYGPNGRGEFPLLHLWGEPGAGKTKQAAEICRLAGGIGESGIINISGSTAWPPRDAAITSTTVPIIMDEFRETNRNDSYMTAQMALKAAYLQANVPHGAGGKDGPYTKQLKVTSPLVFCDVFRTSDHELHSRSIIMQIRKSVQHVAAYRASWEILHPGRLGERQLPRWAKLMMREALAMSDDEVLAMYAAEEKLCVIRHEARAIVNHTMPFVGLEFMERVLTKHGVRDDVISHIHSLRESLRAYLQNNAERLAGQSVQRAEAVILMNHLAAMARHSTNGVDFALHSPRDYVRVNNVLYLQANVAFMSFSGSDGKPPSLSRIKSSANMEDTLRESAFYVGKGPLPTASHAGVWHIIDLDELAKVGVDVDSFRRSA